MSLQSFARPEDRRDLLADCLTRNAVNFPAKPAIADLLTGATLTFAELDRRVNAGANVLHEDFALCTGDRIAILGRNHVDTIVLYFAAARIGAVAVPLNFRANTAELQYILDDCTPSVLAISQEFDARIDAGLFVGRDKLVFGSDASSDQFALLVAAASTSAPTLDVDDEAPAFILYTGGTTGQPKGVAQCQAAYVALAQNMLLAMAPQAVSRDDAWLMCAPLYHGGGWAYTVTTLYWGMTLHLLREFDAAAVTRATMAKQGSLVWLVPTMSRRVVEHVRASGIDPAALDHLRLIVSAGAPLDSKLRTEIGQIFRRATILDMVGQTEVTSTTIALSEPRDIAHKSHAVGLPVPGMSIALLDETNTPVPAGDIGEICYRGKQTMLGYWNKPAATAEAMAGGWFHSGDMGRRDAAGVLYLVGRKKDIIKSGGETIVPSEIEDVLRKAPAVRDACVIGVPDADWGERVHAVVACDAVTDADASKAALRNFCKAHLSGYKIPKTWTFVRDLPLSAVGKVERKAVLAMVSADGDRDARAMP